MSTTSNAVKAVVLNRMRAPLLLLIMAQAGQAGVNVMYKLAALDGMNLRILIAYRFLFAFPFMSLLAFCIERKSRPPLTRKIIFLSFLCALFGGSLAQNLYLESLALTSATFASAMLNLAPAITFVLAVAFRFENLAIRSVSGKAKVVGTILSILGAMVLTFYKGFTINLWKTNIHVHGLKNATHPHKDLAIGGLLSLGSSVCVGSWFLIQAKISEEYPAAYSSTALMCTMAALQAVVIALVADHDWEHWKLGFDIRLLTSAYTGAVGSGLCVVILSWCVTLKGPLYVSSFSPLILILVAVAGTLGLGETLHLGSVLGAGIIVAGLYAMLWGKAKEPRVALKSDGEDKGDIEEGFDETSPAPTENETVNIATNS